MITWFLSSVRTLSWDFLIQRDITNGIVLVVSSGQSLWEKTWHQVSMTLLYSILSQEELLLAVIKLIR